MRASQPFPPALPAFSRACRNALHTILLGLSFFPALLFAAELPSLRLMDASSDLPTLAFYRDQPATCTLSATFPPGPNPAIVADLCILANRIAAPIQKAIAIFPEMREPTGTTRVTDLEIPLPAVQKPTHFVLVYRQGDKRIAVQKIEVVPEKSGDFIRAFLAEPEAKRTLSAFGFEPVFRGFLKTNQLTHDDLGPELPDRFASGAFRYDSDAKKQLFGLVTAARTVDEALLIFDPQSNKPPGIYIHGRIALVTLPIFSQLGTDPRAERTLVETLEVLLSNP